LDKSGAIACLARKRESRRILSGGNGCNCGLLKRIESRFDVVHPVVHGWCTALHGGARFVFGVTILWKIEKAASLGEPDKEKPVKTSSAAANGGTVVETVTRQRVVPAEKKESPEFWSYLEKLLPSDWSPHSHKLFIYRYRAEENIAGPMDPMEKNETGVLVMPRGEEVALSNREDAEFAIAQKFGGGLFRLILKRGSERVAETKVHVDAPRRAITPAYMEPTGPTVSTMSDTSTPSDVAHHALNVMANQEKTGYEVAGAALRTTADVLARVAQMPTAPALPPPNETDSMLKMLMLKMMENMINKMTAPAPAETSNAFFAKIQEAAVENLLNPRPSGPVSSAGAELVRQLPQVGGSVVEAIREWRIGQEAQRDTALAMRGAVPTNRAVQQPTAALPAPPAANSAPGGGMGGAPSFEFVESRIIKIMGESATVDEAAEHTYEFLTDLDPAAVVQLTGLGEQGLLNFFSTRPVLKPATGNVPKLQEFIRAFLKYASEDGATQAGTKPN
jgi:hypothetical protein